MVPWVSLQFVIVVFPDHAQCLVTVTVLWPFLMVPWVSLQFVIVVFPDHAQLLLGQMFIFGSNKYINIL